MTKSRGLGPALRNPTVECSVCGRPMTNNLIGRHVAAHDPAAAEARRQRKRDRQRAYNQTPEGKATAARARHSEQGRRAGVERHRKWHRTERGRLAHQAHTAIAAAVRRGTLAKEPCIRCGSPESFAHHPNGYAGACRWDIEWLCLTHHMEAHGRVAAA